MRVSTVGRRTELERLTEAVVAIADGRPRILEILGEPGIGKTHLMSVLRDIANEHGRPTVIGRSAHHLQGIPFGVITDALTEPLTSMPADVRHALGGAGGELLATLFPVLRDGSTPDALHADQQIALCEVVRAIIERLARPAGLVVLFDDIQWADPKSVDILAYLLTHPPRSGVLLAVAHRPRQLPVALAAALQVARDRGQLDVHELGPLSRAETAQFLGPDAGANHGGTLHDVSGGNPCYLAVLLHTGRSAHPGVTCRPVGADIALAFPQQVWIQLLAELETLTPVARLVADAAAVIGDVIIPELLAAAADLPEPDVLAALDELIQRDVLRPCAFSPSVTLRFRHPVLQHFVYQATKTGWKIGAHARTAAALAGMDAPATARAPHVERFGRHGDLAAVAVLTQAGVEAEGTAPVAAARWYAAALRVLPDSPEHHPLRTDLMARVARSDGESSRPAIDPADAGPVGDRSASLGPLSRREREVATLIAHGHTNRQIARRLDVKENTVEVHVGHILRKLRVHSRAAVARIVTLSEAAGTGVS